MGDYIRIKHGEALNTMKQNRYVESAVNDNDRANHLKRLQRLKKWLKENWLGFLALGITVHHC